MVFTTIGLIQIRDSIFADMDNGQAGTSTYPPNVSQTGLLSAVSATDIALSTKFKSSNTISVTHVVTTSLGNGSTVSEWEVRGNTDTDSYNRNVRAGIAKDNTIEITMIHSFNLDSI